CREHVRHSAWRGRRRRGRRTQSLRRALRGRHLGRDRQRLHPRRRSPGRGRARRLPGRVPAPRRALRPDDGRSEGVARCVPGERVPGARGRRACRGRPRGPDQRAGDRLGAPLAPVLLFPWQTPLEGFMEERKTTVEKRTEITREEREPKVTPKTTNVSVGTTQVQEEQEIVDDPVGSTIIRQEETVEKHQR